MRKRDKSANGDAPQIDLETLRASARAADIADKATRSTKPSSRSHQQSEPASPMDTKAQILQHHQSSFQLMAPPPSQEQQSSAMAVDSNSHNSNNNGSSSSGSRSAPQPPPPQHAHQNSMSLPGGVPPPPWATPSSSTSRVYSHAQPDHLQPQSFMRSSQHAPSRWAVPRACTLAYFCLYYPVLVYDDTRFAATYPTTKKFPFFIHPDLLACIFPDFIIRPDIIACNDSGDMFYLEMFYSNWILCLLSIPSPFPIPSSYSFPPPSIHSSTDLFHYSFTVHS